MSLDIWLTTKDIDGNEINVADDFNITHNLTEMADKAGIYYALWRPEEKGWKNAKDITIVLEKGLKKLKSKPEYFKKFNPDNGWGDYGNLIDFTKRYLKVCKKYPSAVIGISR